MVAPACETAQAGGESAKLLAWPRHFKRDGLRFPFAIELN